MVCCWGLFVRRSLFSFFLSVGADSMAWTWLGRWGVEVQLNAAVFTNRMGKRWDTLKEWSQKRRFVHLLQLRCIFRSIFIWRNIICLQLRFLSPISWFWRSLRGRCANRSGPLPFIVPPVVLLFIKYCWDQMVLFDKCYRSQPLTTFEVYCPGSNKWKVELFGGWRGCQSDLLP
jgi:hypothetical protein